jgi:2'-5' RNA ligase
MAMLAIPIQPDISRLFQEFDLDIEKDQSNHITLFYFGDDLPMSRILKIIPAVFELTEDLKPFTAYTQHYSSFDSDDLFPIICPVISQKLIGLRNKIQTSFDNKKVKYNKKFKDFKPHITLGYSKEKLKNTKFPKVEFPISQIALYAGDTIDTKLFVNFPFTINKFANLDNLSSGYLKHAHCLTNLQSV